MNFQPKCVLQLIVLFFSESTKKVAISFVSPVSSLGKMYRKIKKHSL